MNEKMLGREVILSSNSLPFLLYYWQV